MIVILTKDESGPDGYGEVRDDEVGA